MGVYDYLWGGGSDVCLTTTQMNRYLNYAWNYFTSIQLPPNFYRYSFLVSWTESGSNQPNYVTGESYIDYKYQYIYVARIGKLISYPPQS